MNKKSFTLIELIIVIAVIGILTAFIIVNLSGSRGAAYDAVRKNDISNIYKSIVGKKVNNDSNYYEGVAAIKEGETPSELLSFISHFLKTIPYDPNPTKAYLYAGDENNFSLAAILDDGTCFIKSTKNNMFGSESICDDYMEGGLGMVNDFMILHGNRIDITWSIPSAFASSPEEDISTAIICYESETELSESELPSDSDLISQGTVVAIANNKATSLRITPSNPSYYYYCRAITYNENNISNPGTVGSSPNTSTGGFTAGVSSTNDTSSSGYSSSSPSVYSPSEASAIPNNVGGTTSNTTGGTTSSSFAITNPVRLPSGKGTLTLRWRPALGSTHTLIRRLDNVPPDTNTPQSRTDGTQVTLYPNNSDITSWHTYTDDNNGAGLDEQHIYCYSAWGYNEEDETYSPGESVKYFV